MTTEERRKIVTQNGIKPNRIVYKGENVRYSNTDTFALKKLLSFKTGNLFRCVSSKKGIVKLQRRATKYPSDWLFCDFEKCSIIIVATSYKERRLELYFNSPEDTNLYYEGLVSSREIKPINTTKLIKRNPRNKRKFKKLDPKKVKSLAMSDNITCPILRKTLMSIS